jgi:hypothetical protein
MDGLYNTGRVPKESELLAYGEKQGWTLTQTPTGPPTFYDQNGVKRLVIKSGSSQTPGSEDPHIELKDANGQRIDPETGQDVIRKSDGNHRPYLPGC